VTVLMKVVLDEEAPLVDADDGPGSATHKVTTAHRLRTVDMDRVARGGVGALGGGGGGGGNGVPARAASSSGRRNQQSARPESTGQVGERLNRVGSVVFV